MLLLDKGKMQSYFVLVNPWISPENMVTLIQKDSALVEFEALLWGMVT